MGKKKNEHHRLSEIDIEKRTAICSQCGPVKLEKKGRNVYKCAVHMKYKSRMFKFRKKYGVEVTEVTPSTTCFLCGGTTRIAYDHCHKTGKFRGWLCMKCNTALGLVNDDVDILKKMIEYLERP